jgi:hypothetical protein
MSYKSVVELVRMQHEGSSETVSKASAHSDTQYGLPKSWFNDPYALLDSMEIGRAHV